jgi:hypothetical protein
LRITSRTAWNAIKTNIPDKSGALPKVYIHHTAGHYPVNVSEEIQQMHTLQHIAIDVKGYTDIDYNWLIGPSGTVYESRGASKKSAATLGENDVSRSVCFMGNFQGDIPTEVSLQACIELICYLIKIKELVPARQLEVLGHRDNPKHPMATACPGEHLYAYIPRIREAVLNYTPVGDEDMLGARFLRQKGYVNAFVVGEGFPVLHMSQELMDSLLSEDPSIPKIFFDNMAAFHGLCAQAGLDIEDPEQVVPGGPTDRW